MKFIEIPQLQELNNGLSFETPEFKVFGGVDVYTTKAAGSDKKLYKVLEKQLDTHQMNMLNYYEYIRQHPDAILSDPLHQDFLSTSASPPNANTGVLSPPIEDGATFGGRAIDANRRRRLSNQLSTSPFGPLDQAASRKTFAYLISVLNASQPDHDFSSLMPEDFKRESSSSRVINAFNNVLFGLGMPVPPSLWEVLDKEIDLKDSSIYSHTPPQTFLDDEPGTIWCMMWFFFNKKKKRVIHLYLRAERHHHHSPILSAISLKHRNHVDSSQVDEDYDLTYSSDTNSISFDEEDEVVGGLELE